MKPSTLSWILSCPLAAAALGGGVPPAKPETAGMSSERLVRIHDAVQRHIDAGAITGAVTVVARKGHIVHFEAHGLMDAESKRPMEKGAIFRIASMSKPVTAVAVLMLVEEGKLRLTDPVSRFLPEFKRMQVAVPRPVKAPGDEPFYTVPAERDLTIRDLLTHTSGLMSWQSQIPAPKLEPTATLATYVPQFARVPLDFQPGTQWSYSGRGGPDLLSRIVEIVTGQTYYDFLRARLFAPLGMNDTFFYPPADRRPRMVTLYQRSANGLTRAPNQDGFSLPNYHSGAGGLMSTAEDYLQFAQMLANGGELNGKRILSPRTVELMASNHVGDMFNGKLGRPAHGMGFGLLVAVIQDPVAAGLRLSKGTFGWDGAYGTQTWVDPKESMVSIIMMQTQTPALQRDFENAVMQAIVE
ncbi:MAG TPA: serine hydrolase domain-containing protein [Paludibaculum sp.]|jgi:CubicO group peptidase (beta-lactamase class C family)